MREELLRHLIAFIREYEQRPDIVTHWGRPLLGFADAYHPDIQKLKETVAPDHVMPEAVLAQPTVILCYFIPFEEEMADTNWGGDTASPQWARAYEETNALFGLLNQDLCSFIASKGYRAAVTPEASAFDRDLLRSKWSQRHIAKIAGLGTFGVNNMLITQVGCCGRYSSLVTDLPVQPDQPLEEEYCLYKKNGGCGLCVKQCPSGALALDGFDRQRCYATCLQNAEKFKCFGNSYASAGGGPIEETGSEVCGKCVVHMPCSFRKVPEI